MLLELTGLNETELAALVSITFITIFVFANTGLGTNILFIIGYWTLFILGLVNETKLQLSTILIHLSFIGIIQAIIKRKYIFFQFKFTIILLATYGISVTIAILLLFMLPDKFHNSYEGDFRVRILGGLLLLSPIITCVTSLFKCIFPSKPKQWVDIVMDIKDLDSNSHAMEQQQQQELLNTDKLYEKYSIEKDVIFYNMESWKEYIGLIIVAIISGICRGFFGFGLGDVPFIIYQLITDFDRRSFRAIMALMNGVASIIITTVYLLFIDHTFYKSQWVVYVMIFIASCIGLLIGNIYAKYIDQQAFKIIMQFLLLCVAINLVLEGFTKITFYKNIVLAILCVVIIIGLVVRNCLLYVCKTEEEPTQINVFYNENDLDQEEVFRVAKLTEYPINALYSITFSDRLLGVVLTAQGNGMFVKEIKNKSWMDYIQIGSKLIAIDGEIVEDMGKKEIMCRLNTYELPMKIIFLTPLKQRFEDMEFGVQEYESEVTEPMQMQIFRAV